MWYGEGSIMSLEDEYNKLEKELEEDEKYWDRIDSLSDKSCDHCGARLTVDEWEEYEDTCTDCIWEQCQGIIDDEPTEEL